MADAAGGEQKLSVSPVGALLVGLVLGAGILFIYHNRRIGELEKDLATAKANIDVLQKSHKEAMMEIARLRTPGK